MSNAGDIDGPIDFRIFKQKMNRGDFISQTDTHIPTMLSNIINNIDSVDNEVAILVSDMKYSPTGKDAAPNISQYQEEIRNLTASHNFGVAFVCADSEYLNKTGKVVEANSPYYYIIIGKPENVASVRNDIVAWCEGTDSYIASGDLGMNYKNPNYTIQSIKNGGTYKPAPNNVITTYSRDVSDTCSFVIRIDLSGYPSGYTVEQLDSCFMATTTNSSGINYEIIELEDEHNYKGQLQRRAFVDYLVKVYDFQLDDEVVEFSFNSEPLNDSYSSHFNEILSADNENELDKTFSFRNFIQGHHDARKNAFDLEPGKEANYEPRHIRLLISHESE